MAATSISTLVLSVAASAALTAKRAVTIAGAVPSAGATSLGIAQTDGAIGDMVPVNVQGTAVATAGAAIAKGALVEVGTGGKVITKDTGISVGRALSAAAADGDDVEVLLLGN